MLLIPAIDIKDKSCVRLRQGKMEQVTIFSDDPVKVAQHWLSLGARRLHLVDLDAALIGKPCNQDIIKSICQVCADKIPVQVGGGIRKLQTIEAYLKLGVKYLIIGTAAAENYDFVAEACQNFPGHIIVGLDAKDGKVLTKGWVKESKFSVTDLSKRYQDLGVEAIIFTDINRDGMLSGVNIQATAQLAQSFFIPVIASGGVSSFEDLKALCQLESDGVCAAIVGRSIYDGTLDFALAQNFIDQLSVK